MLSGIMIRMLAVTDFDDVREVPGYPGYLVTMCGNVFGPKGLLKSWVSHSNGALYVHLSRNRKKMSVKVSRIVMSAWGPPQPQGAICRHWDDDPLNNWVDNLLWGTYSDNMFDRVRNGIHHEAKKTHCKRNHEFTPSNTYVYPDGRRRCKTCDKQSAWYGKKENPVSREE